MSSKFNHTSQRREMMYLQQFQDQRISCPHQHPRCDGCNDQLSEESGDTQAAMQEADEQ